MSASDQESHAEALSLLQRPPGKRPTFFAHGGVDQLFSVVIELAAEVWVLRERVYAVEDVAGKAGIPLRELVEKWRPSDMQSAELAKMRHGMMQELFRSVDTGQLPSSDVGEAADPVPPRSAETR